MLMTSGDLALSNGFVASHGLASMSPLPSLRMLASGEVPKITKANSRKKKSNASIASSDIANNIKVDRLDPGSLGLYDLYSAQRHKITSSRKQLSMSRVKSRCGVAYSTTDSISGHSHSLVEADATSLSEIAHMILRPSS